MDDVRDTLSATTSRREPTSGRTLSRSIVRSALLAVGLCLLLTIVAVTAAGLTLGARFLSEPGTKAPSKAAKETGGIELCSGWD